jgi:hypothetical protein
MDQGDWRLGDRLVGFAARLLPASSEAGSDGARRSRRTHMPPYDPTLRARRQAAALSALLDAIDLCDRATARLAVILARLGSSQ